MSGQHYLCPLCRTGALRVVPSRQQPAYYVCRGCRETFRADCRIDPGNENRLLLLGVRQNPEIDRRLKAESGGSDFRSRVSSAMTKLDELRKEGVPLEMETYLIGYEDLAPED